MAIGDRSFLSTPRRVWRLMKRIVRSRSAEARVSRSRMSDRRSGHDSESWVYFSVFACCNRPMRRRCTKFYATATASPRGEPAAPLVTSRQRAREPRDAPQSHRALTGRHSRALAEMVRRPRPLASTVGISPPRRKPSAAGNTFSRVPSPPGLGDGGGRERSHPTRAFASGSMFITPRVEPCIETREAHRDQPAPTLPSVAGSVHPLRVSLRLRPLRGPRLG